MSGKAKYNISIGDKFERWEVVSVGPKIRRARSWNVRCECGTTAIIVNAQLGAGKTSSCGCLKIEQAREAYTTHGEGRLWNRTVEYSTWCKIKGRCHDVGNPAYMDYGGRGIFVCEEWLHDYPAFLSYMGRRPKGNYTIERIDNNKGYEPGNVKWATRTEQARNRRSSRYLVVDGVTKTMAEWAEQVGLDVRKIWHRNKLGWSDREAVYGRQSISS